MNKTQTPVAPGDRNEALNPALQSSQGRLGKPRVASLIVGSILCVFAMIFLAGGGWALWKDRAERDANGFVTFGTSDLRTETYAVVGDMQGDGPGWLWGSTVLGDVRVRATAPSERPLFVGIARTDDVVRYLRGVGYATVYSFAVSPDTTHPGDAPSGSPSGEPIWAASTQGTGMQTLVWTPRSGDWSIVFMNADAGAGVTVHGDAGATLPVLPWVAVGLFIAAGASGFIGGWILVRRTRREN